MTAYQAPLRLTYGGNCVERLQADGGQVMGPNTLGEYYQVARVWFDPDGDRTVAAFWLVHPRDLPLIYKDRNGFGRKRSAR